MNELYKEQLDVLVKQNAQLAEQIKTLNFANKVVNKRNAELQAENQQQAEQIAAKIEIIKHQQKWLDDKDAENQRLKEWIAKHLIATCPDGYCSCSSDKAKKCSDGWIAGILKEKAASPQRESE